MREKIIALLCIAGLLGCTQGKSLELQGRVAIKGSAPHTYLTIFDRKTHKTYKIQNKEAFHLLHKQNQTVKLEAKLIKDAIGPGFPAIIEVTEVKEN